MYLYKYFHFTQTSRQSYTFIVLKQHRRRIWSIEHKFERVLNSTAYPKPHTKMNSLVAYISSSDEDSECEETSEKAETPQQSASISKAKDTQSNNHISGTIDDIEDDDESIPQQASNSELKLNLPQPTTLQKKVIAEEDDEFLHKKVAPALIEKPVPQKPKVPARKPVKIMIPTLAEFKDDIDLGTKSMAPVGPHPMLRKGLLSMLPPPKSETFIKKPETSTDTKSKPPITKTTSLIPHTVTNRIKEAQTPKVQPSASTDDKKPSVGSLSQVNYANSDDSDNEDGGDFFSLNNDNKLPEVSASEIKAMVSKKANEMAEFSKQLDAKQQQEQQAYEEYQANVAAAQQPPPNLRDQYDIEALVGTRAAKRARRDDIQFIEISQDEVKPSQEEWMRTSLQAETEPQQQRGLIPVAPGAGTKKKHQITYLAYQAKANEQELQAMWAANRNSRRQTQSKYGF